MATESFSLQIDKFVEKAKGNMQEFVLEFLQDLNADIVLNTPVGVTGFLRGSWGVSFGTASPGRVVADKDGKGTISSMNLALTVGREELIGTVIYAVNSTKYGYFVEYGTSRMAPRAFVRSTLARAPAMAEAAAKRVASR